MTDTADHTDTLLRRLPAPRDAEGGIKWGPLVCGCGHLEDEHGEVCRGCVVEAQDWPHAHSFVGLVQMYDEGVVAPPGMRVVRRAVTLARVEARDE